jgi:RimJ/RimL family protein N-acetyltransferase
MITGEHVRLRQLTQDKAGFEEEGRARRTFRSRGVWHDMVLMGSLEDELVGA